MLSFSSSIILSKKPEVSHSHLSTVELITSIPRSLCLRLLRLLTCRSLLKGLDTIHLPSKTDVPYISLRILFLLLLPFLSLLRIQAELILIEAEVLTLAFETISLPRETYLIESRRRTLTSMTFFRNLIKRTNSYISSVTLRIIYFLFVINSLFRLENSRT